RKPAEAGRFYESDTAGLREQIAGCFTDERGPGSVPEVTHGRGDVKGCIVPHAGYPFSGPIAAHTYDAVARDGMPERFVILGPNHTGYGAPVAMMSQGAWDTPLGSVSLDGKTGEMLREAADEDRVAHMHEHSIEVQLPFLQFLCDDVRFVPVCLARQDQATAEKLGKAIAGVDALPVASTDFSHAGMGYGRRPPMDVAVQDWARQQDEKAIDSIQSMDVERFLDTVRRENISMCGYGAVAAVMYAAVENGAATAELLAYGTSYEVHPGSSCVGYAAMVFR
ncbi:MAG: AmmeMemoRadiSam system protein B, partial [Thermoplasmatota archaeon]